ncbi:MAG: carboxypeptidase-like regulatory domain-containing protein, partial [Bacteroidetes bacterium]|nr:carboxypeptidase-like regulatory domain-containing protein [Bacteroidota bacterium]
MKNILQILFTLVCFIQVIGQNKGKIEGVVKDVEFKQPLPGVNIIIKGTYYGAATDVNGKYIIENINE